MTLYTKYLNISSMYKCVQCWYWLPRNVGKIKSETRRRCVRLRKTGPIFPHLPCYGQGTDVLHPCLDGTRYKYFAAVWPETWHHGLIISTIQFIIHHNNHNDDGVHYGQNNKMEIQRGIVLIPPRATKLTLTQLFLSEVNSNIFTIWGATHQLYHWSYN